MSVAETIQQRIQQLPVAFQEEVLDFTEYLLAKSKRQEEREWSNLSLTFAMQGMEHEPTPHYTLADLKVIFS